MSKHKQPTLSKAAAKGLAWVYMSAAADFESSDPYPSLTTKQRAEAQAALDFIHNLLKWHESRP